MIENSLILGEIWIIFCGLITGFSFVQEDPILFKTLFINFLIPLIAIFGSVFTSLIWVNTLGEKIMFGVAIFGSALGFVSIFGMLHGYLVVLSSKRTIKRRKIKNNK